MNFFVRKEEKILGMQIGNKNVIEIEQTVTPVTIFCWKDMNVCEVFAGSTFQENKKLRKLIREKEEKICKPVCIHGVLIQIAKICL